MNYKLRKRKGKKEWMERRRKKKGGNKSECGKLRTKKQHKETKKLSREWKKRKLFSKGKNKNKPNKLKTNENSMKESWRIEDNLKIANIGHKGNWNE